MRLRRPMEPAALADARDRLTEGITHYWRRGGSRRPAPDPGLHSPEILHLLLVMTNVTCAYCERTSHRPPGVCRRGAKQCLGESVQPKLLAQLERRLEELSRFVADQSSYSAMRRQVVVSYREKLFEP